MPASPTHPIQKRLSALTLSLAFWLGGGPAAAAVLAPAGCPLFHCTAEATGVMSQPLAPVRTPWHAVSNTDLGKLRAQGCSGDGTVLACLFSTDGTGSGVLKVLDAQSLAPKWGSKNAQGYPAPSGTMITDLDAASVSIGEVPVLFADGQLAAGDKNYLYRFSANGAVTAYAALPGTAAFFGLTPISATHGVVSLGNGTLVLIDLDRWVTVGTPFTLPFDNNKAIVLASPSTGTNGTVYVVGGNRQAGVPPTGHLYAVSMSTDASGAVTGLRLRSQFPYAGTTGASPVVVTTGTSGLAYTMVLLHVPGLKPGDTQNRLLSLLDTPDGFVLNPQWQSSDVVGTIAVAQPLAVAPSIDAASQSLFIEYNGTPTLRMHDLVTGTERTDLGSPFNLQALGGGLPADLQLNGHVGADQVGSANVFTLLLAGASASSGEWALGFEPLTATVRWSASLARQPASGMAAWNLSPAKTGGLYCPVVVGPDTGISRICQRGQ